MNDNDNLPRYSHDEVQAFYASGVCSLMAAAARGERAWLTPDESAALLAAEWFLTKQAIAKNERRLKTIIAPPVSEELASTPPAGDASPVPPTGADAGGQAPERGEPEGLAATSRPTTQEAR